MTKVTNNENMRRYVHMALSKMNSSSSEEKEITYDDVIKYYTNGRYSKLEDIPAIEPLDCTSSSPYIDEVVASELDLTVGDIAFISSDSLTLLDSLNENNFVKVGAYIYKIMYTEGKLQVGDFSCDLTEISCNFRVSLVQDPQNHGRVGVYSFGITLL